MLDASVSRHLLLAETLGLAMARRACDILDRHRAALASASNGEARDGEAGDGGARDGEAGAAGNDDDQFAVDNAVFTAVLDAASECLGRFDTRPADDRWCDALLQVINLGRLAALLPPRGEPPSPGRPSRRAGTSRPAGP
jgi:hypothetical protein